MADTRARNKRPVSAHDRAETSGNDGGKSDNPAVNDGKKRNEGLRHQRDVVEPESSGTRSETTSDRVREKSGPSSSTHQKLRKPDETPSTDTSNNNNPRRKSATKQLARKRSARKRFGIRQYFREVLALLKKSYNAGVEAAIAAEVSKRKVLRKETTRPADIAESLSDPSLAAMRRSRDEPARGVGRSSDERATRRRDDADDDDRRITRWPAITRPGDVVSQPPPPAPPKVTGTCVICHKQDGTLQEGTSGQLLCRGCLSLGFLAAHPSAPKPRHRSRSAALRTTVENEAEPSSRNARKGKEPSSLHPHHQPRNPFPAPKPVTETIASRRGAAPTQHLSIPEPPKEQYVPAAWRSGNQKQLEVIPKQKAKEPSKRTTVASIWDDDVPDGGYPDLDAPPVPRLPSLRPLDAIGQPKTTATTIKKDKEEKGKNVQVQVPDARMLLKPEYSPSVYSRQFDSSSSSSPPLKLSYKAVPESEYDDLHPQRTPGWWMNSKGSPS